MSKTSTLQTNIEWTFKYHMARREVIASCGFITIVYRGPKAYVHEKNVPAEVMDHARKLWEEQFGPKPPKPAAVFARAISGQLETLYRGDPLSVSQAVFHEARLLHSCVADRKKPENLVLIGAYLAMLYEHYELPEKTSSAALLGDNFLMQANGGVAEMWRVSVGHDRSVRVYVRPLGERGEGQVLAPFWQHSVLADPRCWKPGSVEKAQAFIRANLQLCHDEELHKSGQVRKKENQ